MGIRTTCPNGHRLNLKAFLGGKKGICPHCGVTFLIPPAENGEGETSEVSVASAAGLSPARPAKVGSRSAVGSPSLVDDPIAAGSTWYVRLPDGQQFGPADQPTMRAWVAEGRVGQHCLVWCDAWPDWRSADCLAIPVPSVGSPPDVSLPGPAAEPARSSPELDRTASPGDTAYPEIEVHESSRVTTARRRRHELRVLIPVVIALAVISAILLVALLIVITRAA